MGADRDLRFRRYFAACSQIAHRANREAIRAHVYQGEGDGPEHVESTTSDWVLAIVLDPEILSHLMSDGEVDVRAVRRRRGSIASARPLANDENRTRLGTIGQPTQMLRDAFTSAMEWALSAAPEAEVAHWRPHSDLDMFMSGAPPDADDDPWPAERVRARIYRFAVMRQLFERFVDIDPEGVRVTLGDLGLSEVEFQRCLDRLAMQYT